MFDLAGPPMLSWFAVHCYSTKRRERKYIIAFFARWLLTVGILEITGGGGQVR